MRSLPLVTIVVLAAILWVVPSIGSRGMGTVGERLPHADRDLFDTDEVEGAARETLHAADAQVEAAIAR